MILKRKAKKPPEIGMLLIGGPFDARTLYNPLPEVGESIMLSFDGGDEHYYKCETSLTASFTGTVTAQERARRTEVRISEPAPDPTK